MAQTTETPAPLVDDVRVKDLYSDCIVGMSFSQGNLHITFGSFTADHTKGDPAPSHRVVSARIVIAAPTIIELRDMLNTVITALTQQGMISQPPIPPTSVTPSGRAH